MQIRKILKHLLVCIFCVTTLIGASYAAGNVPFGDVGEYGNWMTEDNMQKYNSALSEDATQFQQTFQTNLHKTNFVPLEVKIGLSFIKSLSAIDSFLEKSLVRFVIMFLFIMYAFWIGLEAYKLIKESSDYKKVLYDIFIKGIKLSVWVVVLIYGPARLFSVLIDPIIMLSVNVSDFILDATAKVYNVDIPDTCATVREFVNARTTDRLLVDPNTAANIMCLPARLSVYFYHATAAAFEWFINGFTHSLAMVLTGAVCIFVFIKCIFKYAFMTLGVVADLFLTLLMLPFTAVAETLPSTKESNYAGQIFSGFLKVFNTKKLSDVISVFVNVAVYFVSLSIIISICAALLTNIISINEQNTYTVGSAMVNILCACIILYFAGRADSLAKEIGGKIDNSFGEKLQKDTKRIWSGAKAAGGKLFKAWLKSK